jgi:hypothetical protein
VTVFSGLCFLTVVIVPIMRPSSLIWRESSQILLEKIVHGVQVYILENVFFQNVHYLGFLRMADYQCLSSGCSKCISVPCIQSKLPERFLELLFTMKSPLGFQVL